MIEIQNISFAYSHKKIFDNFSTTFDTNTITTIVGHSGSGKSTLFKLLTHQLTPTEGLILYEGKPLESFPNKTAVMTQDGNLIPWFTIKKNLEIIVKLTGTTQSLDAIVHDLKIQDIIDKYPHELSGGEYQRCDLARILVGNPKYILLDEPTSSLDLKLKETLQLILLNMQKKYNLTILVITHDIDEAIRLGDTILVMSNTPTIINNSLNLYSTDELRQIMRKELGLYK